MKKQLILTVGLPASGKSTWAKAWVAFESESRVRVNRDDIRRQLGPYWIPKRENLVTVIERMMVQEALDLGYSVVIDATNFKYDKWIKTAEVYEAEFVIQDFTSVPLDVCIERDKSREESERVGSEVILRMYNNYIKNEKT